MGNPEPSKPAQRPQSRVIVIIACIALLPIVYAVFLAPPQALDTPLQLERGDDGALHPVSNEAPAKTGLHFAGHTGKLNSRNNTSKGVATSSSPPGYLSIRSVIVMNDSDHLLLKRVGEELVAQLRDDEHIDRLDYYPVGHMPKIGAAAPDFFITLGLDAVKHSGTLGHTLDATVNATIGTTLTRGNSSTHDHLTPPTVEINGTISIEHHSEFTGVETSASKYVLQGKDIATQLVKSINDTLQDTRDDSELMPELPDAFYPEWREAPEFDFLDTYEAERLTGFHQLMSRNESFWKLRPVDDPIGVLMGIQDELRERGWKGGGKDEPKTNYIRMTHDAQVIEVFEPAKRGHARSRVTITFGEQKPAPIPKVQLYARFDDRMTREELTQALQEMLTSGDADAGLLLGLHRYARHDLSEQIVAAAKANPRLSTNSLIALANIYAIRKDATEVTQILNRLHHLTYVTMDTREIDKETKKHIKKLKLDKAEIEKIDRAVFDELGFLAVDPNAMPYEVTMNAGESARLLFSGDDEEFAVLTVDVERVNSSTELPTHSVRVAQGGPRHGRSSSFSSGFNLDSPYRQNVQFYGQQYSLITSQTEDGQIRVEMDKK